MEETKRTFHSFKGAKKGDDLVKSLEGSGGSVVDLSSLKITQSGQVVNTSDTDTDSSSSGEKK